MYKGLARKAGPFFLPPIEGQKGLKVLRRFKSFKGSRVQKFKELITFEAKHEAINALWAQHT